MTEFLLIAQNLYAAFAGIYVLLALLAVHAYLLKRTRLALGQLWMCSLNAIYCAICLKFSTSEPDLRSSTVLIGLTAAAGFGSMSAYLYAIREYFGVQRRWMNVLLPLLASIGMLILGMCVSTALLDWPGVFTNAGLPMENELLRRIYHGLAPTPAIQALLGIGTLALITTWGLLFWNLRESFRSDTLMFVGLGLCIATSINDHILGALGLAGMIPLASLGYVVEGVGFHLRLARSQHLEQEALQSEVRRLTSLAEAHHFALFLCHEVKGVLASLPPETSHRGLAYLDQLSRFFVTRSREPDRAKTGVNLDLGRTIREAIAASASTIERAKVRVELDVDECGEVPVAREEVLLVFVNLIRNSVQALESSAVTNRVVQIKKAPDATLGTVVVLFRDSGPGFTPDQAKQAFQIRPDAKHSGYGLAIVREAMLSARGLVSLSGPGPNPEFRLEFPKA